MSNLSGKVKTVAVRFVRGRGRIELIREMKTEKVESLSNSQANFHTLLTLS